ncbi:hypothetical protein ABZ951_12825 [Streptomyces sp. NPDC046215]|uniref:Transcriptional regulator n=1 Tax=Streptomyces stramineus TaxID=173861 RepID=A0ABN1BE73_9ACTN
MTRSRHPLALLRALTGDTQLSYALLVADTHEALGFGKLHRRREKVSRWETQGVPPDHSTQLAIAHIHRVPEEEVQRLGWPHWLHLGTAATPRADRARHGEEDAGAVPEKERPTVHPARCRLTVTGAALAAFVRETRTAVTVAPPAARGAHRVTSETLALIEDRSYALYELVSTVNPVTLYRLSRAELDLTCALLADSGHDRATGARLQLVTAHIAHLCGLISKGLGEDVRAERHYLAAVRAAARAASPLTVSLCLADLAWSHIDAGDPADVLSLVEAARAITPAPPPGLSAVLHSREARAYARRGEIIAGARALDRTVDALGTGGDPSPYGNVDEEWLDMAAARAWLDAGQPKRALEHFTGLVTGRARPGGSAQPPLLVARDLLAVADAQLALREPEAAVRSARRAVALFDRVPAGVVGQCRRRFLPHTGVPAVQELIGFLAEAPAA